jgi:hypothetical protein
MSDTDFNHRCDIHTLLGGSWKNVCTLRLTREGSIRMVNGN